MVSTTDRPLCPTPAARAEHHGYVYHRCNRCGAFFCKEEPPTPTSSPQSALRYCCGHWQRFTLGNYQRTP